MNINATLIFQSIAFAIFVLLTMKYVWPVILKMLEDRKAKIADGLAAAERGLKALEEASAKRDQQLAEARAQAQELLASANKQAAQILEQAREAAKADGARIVEQAQAEIQREIIQARESLRRQVGELAVLGASRIIEREIDAKAHAAVLDALATEI